MPVLTVSGIAQANSWDWVATVSNALFLRRAILFAVGVLAFAALSLVNVAAVTVVILSVALTRSLCEESWPESSKLAIVRRATYHGTMVAREATNVCQMCGEQAGANHSKLQTCTASLSVTAVV